MSDDRQSEADKALAEARAAVDRVESIRQRVEPVLDRLDTRIEENALLKAFRSTLRSAT